MPPAHAALLGVRHETAIVNLLSFIEPTTFFTLAVTAAVVGDVTPVRAPSRAALLIVSDALKAMPKSTVPKKIIRKTGTTSANSTIACPGDREEPRRRRRRVCAGRSICVLSPQNGHLRRPIGVTAVPSQRVRGIVPEPEVPL